MTQTIFSRYNPIKAEEVEADLRQLSNWEKCRPPGKTYGPAVCRPSGHIKETVQECVSFEKTSHMLTENSITP